MTAEHCVALFDAYTAARDEDKAIAALQAYSKIEGRELASGLVSYSELSQTPAPKKRQGGKGITSLGKRMVKSGVGWFFEECDRCLLTFLTVTMPSLCVEQYQTYCEKFSQIQKRFMEEVSRQLGRCGLPTDFVLVVEVQPERWESHGEVALHLHVLFKGRNSRTEPWAISKSWLPRVWRRILQSHIGGTVNTIAATRVEVPKKRNLKGEMGKYMSKGGICINEIHRAGLSHLLPRRWWGMSADLKARIRRNIRKHETPAATEFDRSLPIFREQGLLSFHRIIEESVDEETGEITLKDRGAVGRFSSTKAKQIVMYACEYYSHLLREKPVTLFPITLRHCIHRATEIVNSANSEIEYSPPMPVTLSRRVA